MAAHNSNTTIEDAQSPPLPEGDPELERDFEAWAEWLIDVFLETSARERVADAHPQVDLEPRSPTMSGKVEH